MSAIDQTASDSNTISQSSLDKILQPFQVTADRVHSVYSNSTHKVESITPYEGYTTSNLPGISNVLFSPYEFYVGMKHLIQGKQKNDHEGLLDNTIRLLGMPFSIVGSIGAILTYDTFITKLPPALIPALIKYLPGSLIFELILCSIEMGVELVNLKRTSHLRDKMHLGILKEIRKGINAPTPEEQFQHLKKVFKMIKAAPKLMKFFEGYDELNADELSDVFQHMHKMTFMAGINKLQRKYLHISPKKIQGVVEKVNKSFQGTAQEKMDKIKSELNDTLKGQKTKLARRIGSWLVKEIDMKIDRIYSGLHSLDPVVKEAAMVEAEGIIKDIDAQTKKKMIIHIIGIIALAITMVAIVAFLVGCPYVAVAILFGVGMAFGIARYVAYKGYFEQRGWNFSALNLLPEFLQKETLDWKGYRKKEKELAKITYGNPTYMIGYRAPPIPKFSMTTFRPIDPARVSA